MDAIIKFFSGIADLLGGVADFFIGFLRDTLYIIQLTAKAVASIPSFFSWLPPPVVAMIATIFSIVVIYKILGRE